MKKILSCGEFICCVVEKREEDFSLFAKAATLCYQDKSLEDLEGFDAQELALMQQNISSQGEGYWRDLFEKLEYVGFILFQGEIDAEHIVGQTGLDLSHEEAMQNAIFLDSHILSDFRRMGLSQLLYEARFQYLREHTSCEYARLGIAVGNIASQKAAQKAGFTLTDQDQDNEGRPMFVYDVVVQRVPKPDVGPSQPEWGLDLF